MQFCGSSSSFQQDSKMYLFHMVQLFKDANKMKYLERFNLWIFLIDNLAL